VVDATSRIAAPREVAFQEIYAAYRPRLRAYLRTVLGATPDVEDVLQEVLMSIYGALPDFDPRRGAMDAFFFTIARNTALAYKRRHRPLPRDPHDLARDLEAPQFEDGFFAVIEELPLPHRQALTLRFVFGLDSDEAAKVMGRTPESVRKLQSRGYRMMRSSSDDASSIGATRRSYPLVRLRGTSPVLLARRFIFGSY
jgi:RNA polymerase sigma-70 factor (ECF subfamily)